MNNYILVLLLLLLLLTSLKLIEGGGTYRSNRISVREKDLKALYEQYATGGNKDAVDSSLSEHKTDFRIEYLLSLAKKYDGDSSKKAISLSLWKALLSVVLFDHNDVDDVSNGIVDVSKKDNSVQLVKVQSLSGQSKTKYYLLEDKGAVIDCFYSLSSHYYSSSKYNEAILMLSNSIAINPTFSEGLIRRAEILSALGRHSEAVADIDRVVEFTNPLYLELLYRRGAAKRSQGDIIGALADFDYALTLPAGNADSKGITMHKRGNVQADLGRNDEAIASFKRAIKLGTSLSHAYDDLAAVYIEKGDWKNALQYIDLSMDVNAKAGQSNKLAFARRGLLNQNLGRHFIAIKDLKTCLELDSRDTQCLILLGVCYLSVGQFADSKKVFDKLLSIDSKHFGWSRKEVMLYTARHAFDPMLSFNPDDNLEGFVRYYGSKFVSVPIPSKSVYLPYDKRPGEQNLNRVFVPTEAFNESVRVLFNETGAYSSWIQLNTTGFLPNQRSHASFGIAVLQMAQKLNAHVSKLRQGKRGLLVPDVASSNLNYFGIDKCSEEEGEECPAGYHVFGWRDYFDVYVRWRQLSEPMDSVWWADRFPPSEEDQNSKSINTNLVTNGNCRPVRYYSYFPQALQLTKELVTTVGYYTSDSPLTPQKFPSNKVNGLKAAKNVKALMAAVGRSFAVKIPLLSASTGKNISGGTLMIDGKGFNGPDMTIMFGVTSETHTMYQRELHFTFQRLVEALVAASEGLNVAEEGREQEKVALAREALSKALEVFYYWVNLTPLSRGSSACGYGAVYAAVLSLGYTINSRIPYKKQFDFEAFFSLSSTQFADTVTSWLTDLQPSSSRLQSLVRAMAEDERDSLMSVEVTADVAAASVVSRADDAIVVDKLFENTASILYVLSRLDEYRPPFFV